MTPQEINALIERAGLSDVIQVFNSAIEIDGHGFHSDGRRGLDAYEALSSLLAFYGAECARAERERAAHACEARARELSISRIGVPHDPADEIAYRDAADLIRALNP